MSNQFFSYCEIPSYIWLEFGGERRHTRSSNSKSRIGGYFWDTLNYFWDTLHHEKIGIEIEQRKEQWKLLKSVLETELGHVNSKITKNKNCLFFAVSLRKIFSLLNAPRILSDTHKNFFIKIFYHTNSLDRNALWETHKLKFNY